MARRLSHLVLASAIPLLGCGNALVTTPNLSGNWQIQSGASITPTPTGIFYLQGALQTQGSQVTGTLGGTTICPVQPFSSYTGSIDASGNLSLASTSTQIHLASVTTPEELATGTISGAGMVCALAVSSTPSVGTQIASLTGTFSGPITAPTPPISTGTLSLALTQSTTPNSSGQFPLTGTLTFTTGSCTTTISTTGTVSGVGLTLASSPSPVAGQNYASLTASTNPTASQLTASSIVFTPSPCSASASSSTTYTGTLTRQ